MNPQQNAISLARVSASSLIGNSIVRNVVKHRIGRNRIAFRVIVWIILIASIDNSIAYTNNPFAMYYSQFDDSIEYGFARSSQSNSEAMVMTTFEGDSSQNSNKIAWFFKRDTMNRIVYDSIIHYQKLHDGAATKYAPETCHLMEFLKNRTYKDSVTSNCPVPSEPMLFPRSNHRIYILWNGLLGFEFSKDTSLTIGTGARMRKITINAIFK